MRLERLGLGSRTFFLVAAIFLISVGVERLLHAYSLHGYVNLIDLQHQLQNLADAGAQEPLFEQNTGMGLDKCRPVGAQHILVRRQKAMSGI